MGTGKQYSEEYKKEAVKLAKEIGNKAAAEELGIPKGTIGTWVSKAKAGEIDTGAGTRTPEESLSLAQQLKEANKRIKELEKKNRQLEELNEFLDPGVEEPGRSLLVGGNLLGGEDALQGNAALGRHS